MSKMTLDKMMWQSWACWLGWWTAFLNIFIVLEQLARSPETAETLLPPCLWCCCFFVCVYVCVSHKYADSLRPSPSLSITHKQAGYATFWKHTHTRVDTLTQMNRCMHICSRAQVHPHTHTRLHPDERTNKRWNAHTHSGAHTCVQADAAQPRIPLIL